MPDYRQKAPAHPKLSPVFMCIMIVGLGYFAAVALILVHFIIKFW
jgi:hypothetical protein